MPSEYPYRYQLCTDMDQIEEPARPSLEGFRFLAIVTNLFGLLLLILVAVWCTEYRGGFAWNSAPSLEFNWHPMLMTTGFVFLYANAMLIYRTQRTVRKRRLKLFHAGLMFSIILLVVIALVAVFDSHNLAKPPIPNMYSLHSWVGMTSVILFCCQWVAGLVSFLYPGIQPPLRSSYMPIHVYFGTAGFVGVIAACLLGLNEKGFFMGDYSKFTGEGILINVIGLNLVVFGGLTVYLVSQSNYKRQPQPEDDNLLPASGNQ